jgi:hypothetical protein
MLYFKKLANHKGNWIKGELANHVGKKKEVWNLKTTICKSQWLH